MIVVLTMVKDGIEDWRRSNLDDELNNSRVQKLMDWENVNVSIDNVGSWRTFKKWLSHSISFAWKTLQHKRANKRSGSKGYTSAAMDQPRDSFASRPDSYISTKPGRVEGIPMTQVSSPLPRTTNDSNTDRGHNRERSSTAFSYEGSVQVESSQNGNIERQDPPAKDDGDVLNPHKTIRGKARFKRDFWKNIGVGDCVRLYNDDEIPADIAILASSDPDGACYVETKNLDGETNLKVRHALRCGRQIHHARDCERAEFILESEPPHANLYAYSGAVRWNQKDPQKPEQVGVERVEPLGINNMLLRGCNLRNTEWIVGVVVYTGQDTKIMINAGVSPSKRSRIARELNWVVIYNFIILLVMCFVSGVANGITFSKTDESWYHYEFGMIGGQAAVTGTVTFFAAVVLYQNLIPISLYISLEIIRLFQAFFIWSDTHMYYEPLDYPCTPKAWNISDDVGQVEYIFSDKTGTLTQNVMEFKKCTVNGHAYGEAYTEALAGMQRRQGKDVEAESRKANKEIAEHRVLMLQNLRSIHNNPFLHDDDLTFVANDFAEDLRGAAGPEQKAANEHFMLALALCHSVLAERTPGDPPKLVFKAQSPDETALVGTARDCGFTVLGRQNDTIFLNVQGVEKEYTVLNTLEFNSSRKRMSAIVRMDDGRIILFCKGADSIIYSRLRKGAQPTLKKETAEHLEMFAREGLRTLCVAQKVLTNEEYEAWSKEHDLAAASINERDEKLEAVSDAIERDLDLIGGTAIEDRLQDGVPDTIALLAKGGIKLWVLTGDKVETAINIGFACNLLSNDLDLIVLRFETTDLDIVDKELTKHLAVFNMTGSDAELKYAKKNHEPPPSTHALVIDGDALKLVLEDQVRQKFLLLCTQCKSVLCCRVSPSQKAAVVSLVKKTLDVMTLSIGDGANDVAMIQEADIGVGIAGEEGRQAVMSADYAIGQFRFLQRLVLVHGRWSYRRLGECIPNFFYKVSIDSLLMSGCGKVLTRIQNMVWTFALYWYQIYDNADCAYIFEYTYILLYNTIFTSIPIVFQGVLDQDVSDKVSLAVPELYRRGIERKEWTILKFWLYMGDAAYQSLICFFVPYILFSQASSVTSNGLDLDQNSRIGVYIASIAVFVVNTYVLMNTYRWDWLICLLVAISILLLWLWTGVYSSFTHSSEFYHSGKEVYGTLSYWVTILIGIVLCFLPRFSIKAAQKIFFPRDVDIIREQVKQGKFKYLDDIDADHPIGHMGKGYRDSKTSDPNSVANGKQQLWFDDEERPIYPPSVAPTTATTTYTHQRTNQGSDSTEFFSRRSIERQPRAASIVDIPLSRPLSLIRVSTDRPRPCFERVRTSMDVTRPSFEASNDFTSASRLMRAEASCRDDQHLGRIPRTITAPLPSSTTSGVRPRPLRGPSHLRQ